MVKKKTVGKSESAVSLSEGQAARRDDDKDRGRKSRSRRRKRRKGVRRDRRRRRHRKRRRSVSSYSSSSLSSQSSYDDDDEDEEESESYYGSSDGDSETDSEWEEEQRRRRRKRKAKRKRKKPQQQQLQQQKQKPNQYPEVELVVVNDGDKRRKQKKKRRSRSSKKNKNRKPAATSASPTKETAAAVAAQALMDMKFIVPTSDVDPTLKFNYIDNQQERLRMLKPSLCQRACTAQRTCLWMLVALLATIVCGGVFMLLHAQGQRTRIEGLCLDRTVMVRERVDGLVDYALGYAGLWRTTGDNMTTADINQFRNTFGTGPAAGHSVMNKTCTLPFMMDVIPFNQRTAYENKHGVAIKGLKPTTGELISLPNLSSGHYFITRMSPPSYVGVDLLTVFSDETRATVVDDKQILMQPPLPKLPYVPSPSGGHSSGSGGAPGPKSAEPTMMATEVGEGLAEVSEEKYAYIVVPIVDKASGTVKQAVAVGFSMAAIMRDIDAQLTKPDNVHMHLMDVGAQSDIDRAIELIGEDETAEHIDERIESASKSSVYYSSLKSSDSGASTVRMDMFGRTLYLSCAWEITLIQERLTEMWFWLTCAVAVLLMGSVVAMRFAGEREKDVFDRSYALLEAQEKHYLRLLREQAVKRAFIDPVSAGKQDDDQDSSSPSSSPPPSSRGDGGHEIKVEQEDDDDHEERKRGENALMLLAEPGQPINNINNHAMEAEQPGGLQRQRGIERVPSEGVLHEGEAEQPPLQQQQQQQPKKKASRFGGLGLSIATPAAPSEQQELLQPEQKIIGGSSSSSMNNNNGIQLEAISLRDHSNNRPNAPPQQEHGKEAAEDDEFKTGGMPPAGNVALPDLIDSASVDGPGRSGMVEVVEAPVQQEPDMAMLAGSAAVVEDQRSVVLPPARHGRRRPPPSTRHSSSRSSSSSVSSANSSNPGSSSRKSGAFSSFFARLTGSMSSEPIAETSAEAEAAERGDHVPMLKLKQQQQQSTTEGEKGPPAILQRQGSVSVSTSMSRSRYLGLRVQVEDQRETNDLLDEYVENEYVQQISNLVDTVRRVRSHLNNHEFDELADVDFFRTDRSRSVSIVSD